VVGAALVPAIFGDRYVDAVLPFQILVAVVPLRFLNNGYGLSLSALDAQHTRARIDGAAALFNVVANVIVLPRWGAVGAAATTLATDLLLLAALRVALGRRQTGLGELGLVLHAAALGAALYLAVSFVPGGWIVQVVAGIALWPLLVAGTGLLQRSHLAAARRL
jgi:O-antigen/teichoic acid export membrane protein